MKYRGFTANILYDEQDRIFFGHLYGTYDNVHFEGSSIDELESAFQEAVDDYLDYCKEMNRSPRRPPIQMPIDKITIAVAVSPQINKRAEEVAQERGVSLDVVVEDALSRTVQIPTSLVESIS